MIPYDAHLYIGSFLFEGIDQIDLTGPFEVLSRIPNATYHTYGKTAAPVRDLKGLRLTPDAPLAEAPPLDVLHVPGGYGQEALMEDTEVLAWIQKHAKHQRTGSEIIAWTHWQENRAPDNPEGREYLNEIHKKGAPGREDIVTWFDVLDMDDYVSFGGKS